MKKSLLFILVFIFSLQGLKAQVHYSPGGHPEDSLIVTTSHHPPHDGSNTLGQSYLNQNVCGLNYVEVDTIVETRSSTYGFNANGTGLPCTMKLKGLPGGCDSIIKAFVYWTTSYTNGPANPCTLSVKNPSASNFTYNVATIGLSVAQNWGDIGTAAYRADVTNSISGNGNYTFNLTGAGNSATEVDGICMIVIYKDFTVTYSGSIVLYDGCDAECTSGVTLDYTGTGFNVCGTTGTANAFGLFGDMQSNIGSGTNTQTYNGSTATFNNNFWNFCLVPTTVTAGQTTCVFDTYTNDLSDCYVWSLAGLYWQNTACKTCTTGGGSLNLTTTQVNPTCGNSNGSAIVTATGGTGPYTYVWSNGVTTSSITGMPAGLDSVTVKDATCLKGTIKVNLVNLSSTSITASSSNIMCYGSSTGSASVLSVTGGTGTITYTWTPNVSTTATATGLPAGTYSVAIADGSGCSHDTTFVITQSPEIHDSITNSKNVTCGGNNGTATIGVKGGTGAYKYLWSNAQTNATATGLAAGTYTITITDANGCQKDTTVTITQSSSLRDSISAVTEVSCYGGKTGSATVGVKGGTSPYTYLWTNTQTVPTATNLITGSYTVTVTDASGCTDTAIAHITQPAQIRDSITVLNDKICAGIKGNVTVGVTGGTGPYGYSWSNGETNASDTGLGAGTYTLTLTDANGCVGPPVTVTVTTSPPLVITASAPAYICAGGFVAPTATGSGGDGVYTYTWTPGNIVAQNITVSPTVTTTYTVTLTDNCGTTPVQAAVVVTVNPTPVVAFTPDTLQGCYPQCINFTNGTTPVGAIKTWEWSFGNGDTAMSKNPKVCYTKPGQYTVTLIAISDSGCKQQLIVPNMITVFDHPHANFTASPQPTNILQPNIQFADQSVDQYGIMSWFWVFGDGADSTSAAQNPSHTYKDTGTFCPTLVVTNIHNCTDSIEKCITIDPFFALYIPNAFTPNHDGLNDVFLAEGKYICSFEMYIFDRWGMQIFHSTDITKGWDGTVGGDSKPVQEDTYVYLIKATDCREQHQVHTFVGKVTLVR